MTRVEEDPDVPRHRRRRAKKKWRVEVKWRPWREGSRPEWSYGGTYEDETAARDGFRAHLKMRWYTRVRLLNAEGEVVAEEPGQAAAVFATQDRRI